MVFLEASYSYDDYDANNVTLIERPRLLARFFLTFPFPSSSRSRFRPRFCPSKILTWLNWAELSWAELIFEAARASWLSKWLWATCVATWTFFSFVVGSRCHFFLSVFVSVFVFVFVFVFGGFSSTRGNLRAASNLVFRFSFDLLVSFQLPFECCLCEKRTSSRKLMILND